MRVKPKKLSSGNDYIGVFDSGFGGLEILREIVKRLPNYDFIYLGDSARSPYGERSQKIIYGFTREAVKFLFHQRCSLVILACNTASSEALRKIQRKFLPENYPQKKVLGVIIPVAESAVEKTNNKKIGVIATESTIRSGAFEKEIKKLDPEIKVYQNPCPLLVPVIENGEEDKKLIKLVLTKCLNPLLKKDIDTLILGCTHYGLLKKEISKIAGRGVNIISEGEIVAEKLRNYLGHHQEIDRKISKRSRIKFLTTDLTEKFKILGSKFFGREINPETVEL